MKRTTVKEMSADVLAALKLKDEKRFGKISVSDLVEIALAINAVTADRLVKGERVEMRQIGVLHLEVNKTTRRLIPGLGIVTIPAQYNVDFSPSSVLERKFAGLPPLNPPVEVFAEDTEEIEVVDTVVAPVLTPADPGGVENPFEKHLPIPKSVFAGKLGRPAVAKTSKKKN